MHPATSISDIQWKEEQVSTVQGYIFYSLLSYPYQMVKLI